jgi:hypothetical protein
VQTQPLHFPQGSQGSSSPGFSKTTINANATLQKEEPMLGVLLSWQLPSQWVRVWIGRPDNFLFRDGTFYSQLSSIWQRSLAENPSNNCSIFKG